MKNKNIQKKKNYALNKYIRISPKKVRKILTQIQGKSYKNALMHLEFMPYKACEIIWQLIYSAGANAFYKMKLKKENLIIDKAIANKGPTLKRFHGHAKGRIVPIHKPTCHLQISVIEISKF